MIDVINDLIALKEKLDKKSALNRIISISPSLDNDKYDVQMSQDKFLENFDSYYIVDRNRGEYPFKLVANIENCNCFCLVKLNDLKKLDAGKDYLRKIAEEE